MQGLASGQQVAAHCSVRPELWGQVGVRRVETGQPLCGVVWLHRWLRPEVQWGELSSQVSRKGSVVYAGNPTEEWAASREPGEEWEWRRNPALAVSATS